MVIEKDKYHSRVIGYGSKLDIVRTPDGALHIDVRDVPSCTWQLDGGSFFCTHDEREIVEYVEDHMGFQGHYQTESTGYACAECEEPLEGSPAEDRYEAMIDAQIDEMRDED